MKHVKPIILSVLFIFCLSFIGCRQDHAINSTSEFDFGELSAFANENLINAIIEIPAGTNEKWELDKGLEKFEIEIIKNKKRNIDYLAYPANYGLIPKTLMPKTQGGDGDPLDVFVIGAAKTQGSIIKCVPLAILHFLDDGEKDDKIIAVDANATLVQINDLNQLQNEYPGIIDILKIWISNYKGARKTQFLSLGNEKEALEIIKLTSQHYNRHHKN